MILQANNLSFRKLQIQFVDQGDWEGTAFPFEI